MHCHTKRLLKYHNYILLSVYILIYFVRYNISLYIGGDYLLLKFSPSEYACFRSVCFQEFIHFRYGTEVPVVQPMFVGLQINNLLGVNTILLHK
jgi:hypothetical protein